MKTPAAEVVAAVAKRNADVVAKETAAVAKYSYSGGSSAAADASGGAGEAAADPNALPAGWDYEYDGDGNIYFIAPDGQSRATSWRLPRRLLEPWVHSLTRAAALLALVVSLPASLTHYLPLLCPSALPCPALTCPPMPAGTSTWDDPRVKR